jgi:hypothetical protein
VIVRGEIDEDRSLPGGHGILDPMTSLTPSAEERWGAFFR